MHEVHGAVSHVDLEVERERAHEVLGVLVGVRQGPIDRLLTEVAFVLGWVGAAAVFEVARDRVIVVSVDGRDAELLDQRTDLVGVRAVPDQVAAAIDAPDVELFDALKRDLQGRQVGVDVWRSNSACAICERPALWVQTNSIDSYQFNRYM
jgi:hypothetical protein